MEIMVCAVCGKPLRFEADTSAPVEPPEPEPIMCPYGAHDAGQRVTTGFWRSCTMSPDEQDAWLAGDTASSDGSG
jgi:hypothetical protein